MLFLTFLFSLPFLPLAISASHDKPHDPCTITSPTTGAFFDLNKITVPALENGKPVKKDGLDHSWHARGYDYSVNFTMNFCAPVIEDIKSAVGIDSHLLKNISAFYEHNGKTYSIGQLSTEPVFRGRKLVLNYTNGSPCGDEQTRHTREIIGGDKDKDKDDKKPKENLKNVRRKSSIISLLCDRELAVHAASIALIAADPEECTYFFEARSSAACAGVSTDQQNVGPAAIFGYILLITTIVYLLGGIAYQRTVMHQRGWRQIPNYSIWAGAGSFVKDMIIILFSSCMRLIPSRRGYNQLPINNDNGRSFGRTNEDENRLIDQLDEEWDD